MAKSGADKGYVQKRTPRAEGWTIEKRKIFLDTLAATCNVRESARAAGMNDRSARRVRARDGEFALLWADAFVIGEERLREEVIAAALGQVSTGNNPSGDRGEVVDGPFNPELALKILGIRAGGSSGRRTRKPTYPSQHEVDAALLARLDALDRRKARRAASPDDDRDGATGDGA